MTDIKVERKRGEGRAVATGFLMLTTAKIVFMLAGYVVYFTLPRLFSTGEFGDYGVIIGLLNVFDMVLITGTMQAVSKFVSEREDLERSIRRAANRVQAAISAIVFGILYLGAPIIGNIFKDPNIVTPLRIAAFVPLFYAFYAVSVGSLNGRKLFVQQGVLDIIFAVLKTAGIISMAAMGYGLAGAMGGFSMAAFVILILSLGIMKKYQQRGPLKPFPVRKILAFELWVMVFTLINNVLISTDLFMVKSLLEPSIASVQAGYYTAALTFSRIPYTFVVAVSLMIFPLVSKSTFEEDIETTRIYIRTTLRMTLVFVLPVALIFSSLARDVLVFVYPDQYIAAVPALQILPVAQVLLALMFIAVTMITGSGRPKVSILITAIALTTSVLVCYLLVPHWKIRGAAAGAAVAGVAGFIAASIHLYRRYRAAVPGFTLVRTGIAGIVAWMGTHIMPGEGIVHIAAGIVFIFVSYFSLLIFMRELSFEDLRSLKSYIKR